MLPHISEELWEINGNKTSVFNESYPIYDEKLVIDDIIPIAIQVNGKLRGSIDVQKNINEVDLVCIAKKQENVKLFLKNKNIIKEIIVPKRLVNFVVK